MKRLWFVIVTGIIASLAASCSNDADADILAEVAKNEQKMQDAVNTRAQGTYDMVWIWNKQVIDTATFSSELDSHFYVISHFPMNHLNWVVGAPQIYKYSYYSRWNLSLSYMGYSHSNAYLTNHSWNPRTFFELNDEGYVCQIWLNTDQVAGKQTTLIYDSEKDVWSGSIIVDSMYLARVREPDKAVTLRWNDADFVEGTDPPHHISFQTTGKKR